MEKAPKTCSVCERVYVPSQHMRGSKCGRCNKGTQRKLHDGPFGASNEWLRRKIK